MSDALFQMLGGLGCCYALLATGLWLRAARRMRRASAELALLRRDPVTGLLTRRPWLENAHKLIVRYANPVLVMCDLNLLKRVNDRHSHADGDAVLAHFARLLRTEFGQQALVGRFGGDEFVVLADAPPENAGAQRGAVTRAQEAAANCVVRWRGGVVGASFGIVCAVDLPDFANVDTTRGGDLVAREQFGRLLHAADLACREAKHRCRAEHLVTATQVFDPRSHDVPKHLPTAPTIRARHS